MTSLNHDIVSTCEISGISGLTVANSRQIIYLHHDSGCNTVYIYEFDWTTSELKEQIRKCLLSCEMPRDFVHALVGFGKHFSVFVTEKNGTALLDILRNNSGQIVTSIRLPNNWRYALHIVIV